jgi:hypothetical protein
VDLIVWAIDLFLTSFDLFSSLLFAISQPMAYDSIANNRGEV